MVEPLLGMRTPGALELQEDAERVVDALAERLVAGYALGKKLPKPAYPSGFGRFAKQGWHLVEGMWINGWIFAEGVVAAEIVAGGMTLANAKLEHPREDMAKKHGFAADRAVSFRHQIRIPERRTWMGTLEMFAIHSDGRRTLVRESAPGLVLGEIVRDPRIILHSFDDAAGGPQ
jgi:hypothetical protein